MKWNHENARCVGSHYLLNLKIRLEGLKNTALVVNLLEIQRDTENGAKRKGDMGEKAPLEMLSILYSVEGSLGKILEITIWLFTTGLIVVRMQSYGRR